MYVLDSDTLIYIRKGIAPVVEKISTTAPDLLCITIFNYSELLFGAYKSSQSTRNRAIALDFLHRFVLLDYTKSSAMLFAQNKAALQKAGTPLADMDLMIASIAMANDATLISNNTKHFGRIDGLKLENWFNNEL